MVFYGKGGYDWNTIFNMPIWLRKFVFNKIYEHYNNEKNAQQGNNVEQSINAMKSAGFTQDNLAKAKLGQKPHYAVKTSTK